MIWKETNLFSLSDKLDNLHMETTDGRTLATVCVVSNTKHPLLKILVTLNKILVIPQMKYRWNTMYR